MRITLNQQQILALELSTGIAAGFTVGYLVAWKRAETKFANLATEEIEQAKRYYGDIHEKQHRGEYDPQELIDEMAAKESLEDGLYSDDEIHLHRKHGVFPPELPTYKELAEQYSSNEDVPDYDDVSKETVGAVDEPEDVNVFEKYADDDIIDVENRDTSKPYIITKDEFFTNEPEYQQVTLSYFEGDDVLTDERDRPQDDKSVVGEDNLEKFGVGSGEVNTVYVRNDVIELDFEITRSTGKYTEEVLGFIEHSDRRPGIRKFRGDDE